ncbi:MAG: response regulator [Pseudomonadota bacterium]
MKTTTLIVSPNTANIELLVSELQQRGYQVYTADNSSEALELVKKEKYALVLIDDLLQDMSIIDLISSVMHVDFAINIGLITNMSPSEIHEKFEGWGIVGAIPNPVDTDGIGSFLKRLDMALQFS